MASPSSNKTCYGSNEAVATDSTPCNPQAEVSTCCHFTNICYSNGLCAPGPGMPNGGQTPYYTGECTDRSWPNSTACPSICNNQPGANIGGNGLQWCGSNGYCCYDYTRSDCCRTSSLIFSLAAITSSTILPNSSSTAAVTTSSFSASTDATTTASSSVVFSTPTLPATLPTISPTASPSSSTTSNNHFAAGLGAGIGIAAALLFIIGVTFLIRRRRARNRARQTHENPAHGEMLDITKARTPRRVHELDGQKPLPVEPDGKILVEIDTRGNTFF